MARNKYPEETVNLILEVSLKLFLTKGYDNTSIQDIIDQLGGLSKGAIYHHFKSKESILVAVFDRYSEHVERTMKAVLHDETLNGREKLQRMFMNSLDTRSQRELLSASPNLLDNPKLLAVQMKSTIEDVVPNYIEPVVRQGMEDGSIQTNYPKELSQVLILMSNIWLNPLVYPTTEEEVPQRIAFFNEMTKAMGLSLLGEPLEERLLDIQQLTEEKKNKR